MHCYVGRSQLDFPLLCLIDRTFTAGFRVKRRRFGPPFNRFRIMSERFQFEWIDSDSMGIALDPPKRDFGACFLEQARFQLILRLALPPSVVLRGLIPSAHT